MILITPQPPPGIKYLLGNESRLEPDKRTPLHLHCEECGNLGPLELNREIPANAAGFRVRCTTIEAPEGATGFVQKAEEYYWTYDK